MLFFFNDTATTEIYTLSLHDALPISGSPIDTFPDGVVDRQRLYCTCYVRRRQTTMVRKLFAIMVLDRKSTRLNSSHANISYAVFCLKKKKQTKEIRSLFNASYVSIGV